MTLLRAALILAAICAPGAAMAQPVPTPADTTSLEDERVQAFDLTASASGLDYRIYLRVPEGAPPADGFPVIYLIDGNATFPMMHEALKTAPAQVAVVGIGYPIETRFDFERRYYDLTPPTPLEAMPTRPGTEGRRTGGETAFRSFVLDDLKPAVAARVPVDPDNQTLLGHSLGGLFTLYMMYSRSDAFSTYVAADPSIWWNDRSILKAHRAFIASRVSEAGAAPIHLLVETSGKRRERPGINEDQARRIREMRAGPSGEDVARDLAKLASMDVAFRTFPEETHGSMLASAIADALHFALTHTLED